MTLNRLRGLAAATIAAGAVVAAVASAPANATVLVTYVDPTTGCTHTVYGPDILVQPGPPFPDTFYVRGGFGDDVQCP